MIINGKNSEVNFLEDYIKNGEREAVTTNIPALPSATQKPVAYPCAYYGYKKVRQGFFGCEVPRMISTDFHGPFQYSVGSSPGEPLPPKGPNEPIPIGFYGSTVGLALKRSSDAATFSIGLDCPNTLLGGTNCCRIINGNDAKKACLLANDSGVGEETVYLGNSSVTIRRASKWGSVNYSIASIY